MRIHEILTESRQTIWYHWTPSDFRKFKVGEMGIHFGTKGQANDVRVRHRMGRIGRFIMARLHYSNAFPAKRDVGDWSSQNRWIDYLYDCEIGEATTLQLTSAEVTRLAKAKVKKDFGREVMRRLLERHGFDAIEYPNRGEGTGRYGEGPEETAVMVFSPDQVEIVGEEPTDWEYEFKP